MPVELQLRGVLDAASARGYPIKVVLLASENDSGGELEPFEDPQGYAKTVSDQLGEVRPLRAPVLIVTPHRFGVGGTQPDDAAELTRGLALPERSDGNALAVAAIAAIRRLATAGGHTLPERIPPAQNNLRGILGDRGSDGTGGPWLIAAVVAATVLLGGVLVLVYRWTAARSAA